ncbi:MAG: hypothetical protein HC897_16225 [Thermoanaerobaculia bacterium]|nr:hypothetical protein [Thermoanaerobaculia bacterium]
MRSGWPTTPSSLPQSRAIVAHPPGVVDALFYAGVKLREGGDLGSMGSELAAFGLPADFLREGFAIEGGWGIAFRWKGRPGYFYLRRQPFEKSSYDGYVVERGETGGFYYLLAGGGHGDGLPPIPPGNGGGPQEPPGRGPWLALIEKQKERNPGACDLRFDVVDDRLHRMLGRGDWIVLAASLEEVRRQADALEHAPNPEQRILAAQQLGAMLLVDLEDGPLAGADRLYLLLDPQLPQDLPLQLIAELSSEGPESLRTLPEIYSRELPRAETEAEAAAVIAQLEPSLTRPPAGVDVDRTVILIDSDWNERPETKTQLDRLRQLGFKINEASEQAELVLLLGSTPAAWSVQLDGQRRLDAGTSDWKALFPNLSDLAAIDATVADGQARVLHDLKRGREEALDELVQIAEEIVRRKGEPLERILRRKSKENLKIKISEMIKNPKLLDDFVASGRPAALAET